LVGWKDVLSWTVSWMSEYKCKDGWKNHASKNKQLKIISEKATHFVSEF